MKASTPNAKKVKENRDFIIDEKDVTSTQVFNPFASSSAANNKKKQKKQKRKNKNASVKKKQKQVFEDENKDSQNGFNRLQAASIIQIESLDNKQMRESPKIESKAAISRKANRALVNKQARFSLFDPVIDEQCL